MNGRKEGMTYAQSGVDIDMKSQAIAALVKQLSFRRGEGPRMIDLPGAFTGLIDFGDQVLTLATDGVGPSSSWPRPWGSGTPWASTAWP